MVNNQSRHEVLKSTKVSAYSFLERFKFICRKIASKSIRSWIKIVETRIAHRGLWGNSLCPSMSLTDRHGHTWIFQTQVKPNWARKTRTTILKYFQLFRKGKRTGLVTHGFWYWHIFRVLEVQRSLSKSLVLCSVSRVSVNKAYVTFWIFVHTVIPQLKAKFNNAETKKS